MKVAKEVKIINGKNYVRWSNSKKFVLVEDKTMFAYIVFSMANS
jgi:hypothetical protein